MSVSTVQLERPMGKHHRPENALSTQRLPRMDDMGNIVYVPRHRAPTRMERHMNRKKPWTTRIARAFWRALSKLGVIDNEW